MSAKIKLAIEGLGSTKHSALVVLEKMGVKGSNPNTDGCLISRYLQRTTGEEGYCGYISAAGYDGLLPRHITEIIYEFCEGALPDHFYEDPSIKGDLQANIQPRLW